MDDKEFIQQKELMKKSEEFKNVDIKRSWFYSIDNLEDEIKEKQKFLRIVKRERKLQPEIKVQSPITKEIKIIQSYKIMISKDKKSIYYCKDW